MALRNHSLDGKIEEAAFSEFESKGYEKASLRKIAENAGVTVGAIQTRFKTKNELFYHSVEPFIKDVEALFVNLKEVYEKNCGSLKMTMEEELQLSMETEGEAILNVVYTHYKEALLLLKKSGGSSYEHFFDEILKKKVEMSLSFFKEKGVVLDEKLLSLFITLQFKSYFSLIEHGWDRDTSKKYMKALITYHLGGFQNLFHFENTFGG